MNLTLLRRGSLLYVVPTDALSDPSQCSDLYDCALVTRITSDRFANWAPPGALDTLCEFRRVVLPASQLPRLDAAPANDPSQADADATASAPHPAYAPALAGA